MPPSPTDEAALSIGFRVVRTPGGPKTAAEGGGKHPDTYQLQRVAYDAAHNITVKSVQPTEEAMFILWQNIVSLTRKVDHFRSQAYERYERLERIRTALFGTDWSSVGKDAMLTRLRESFD